MGRLAFITGQLIMETRTRLRQATGNRFLTGGTSVVPGGRSFRQALFAKEAGYNVILLGRLGDDQHGQTILGALSGVGISTQFIEISRDEYTGLSFEVSDGDDSPPLVYFDPGASLGKGDFRLPIEHYLPLCDVALINQWFHPDLCVRVARRAQDHSIPTIYVCSAPPREAGSPAVDYLFLDFSGRPAGSEKDIELGGLQVRKGIYVWSGGCLRVLSPQGREASSLGLDPAASSDRIVARLMGPIARGAEIDERELRLCGVLGGG